jgi:hypothetical protein
MVKYFGRHPYGHCVISDKHKLIFITIPKNASSIMSYYITQKLDGRESNYFDCTEEQKQYYTFCILRNVEDRFVSALHTIVNRRIERYKVNSTIKTIFQLDKHNIIDYVDSKVDEHLVRQKEFIKNIRIDYLLDMKLIDTLGFDKLNFTLKHYFKEQPYNRIASKMIHDKWMLPAVNKAYEKDTELLSKCIKFNVEEFKRKLQLWY